MVECVVEFRITPACALFVTVVTVPALVTTSEETRTQFGVFPLVMIAGGAHIPVY